MDFAARHADQVFTVQSDLQAACAFRNKIRAQAKAAGRDPDRVKVLPGLVPFIGTTRAAAEADRDALTQRIGLEHILTKLERFTGLQLADLNLDKPLHFGPDDLTENRFSNSRARLLLIEAQRGGLTLRQLAARFAAGRGHLLLVGTPAEVAKVVRDWVAAGAADGFNIMSPELPSGIGSFGQQVIPLLRYPNEKRLGAKVCKMAS